MLTLNLDISQKLAIIIPAYHSFFIQMIFTEGGMPKMLTGTWKMVIAKNGIVKTTFDVSNGLTISDNVLTVLRTVSENDFAPGSYTYEIRTDENDYATPWFEGPFISKLKYAKI
jgi:hypothetical protein